MAAISPTIARVGEHEIVVTWTPIAPGDTCEPIKKGLVDFVDRTVQVAGTFGGGTVTVEGSNDGTNYSVLNNVQGTSLSLAAAGVRAVAETPLYTKPVLTGGAASSLTVTLLCRRARGGKEI